MENPIAATRNLINQIEQIADEIAKDSGIEHLSGPQGRTLLYLIKHPDQEIYVKDIEHFLNISKSVTSNLVKRMEKNGFITVNPSTKDKRKKIISLTPKGYDKAEPLTNFHRRLQESLFKSISRDDLEVIRRVGAQLAENIAHYKGETND
ncbi:MarR family winged helix-turn-helix transcriptional regulator [Streptococcus loxodontisalivarius]|uniref:DNA-binding MarR family transcriptional regulator n=1 Tax=Streptococcus loxodontisalivarius TaxID=1349415 RepID=A0ABS2PS85_9STRE|nr:MarR family winged helix-turn-helix transcriptional regulator [Streptococcus loxodontisalivarius]MBM7642897.1 DNA-binding MarR family transcriptional regulator [Streptococcus loxodontisalivarius]